MLDELLKQKLKISINPFEDNLLDIVSTLLFFLLFFFILRDLYYNGVKNIIIFIFITVLILVKVDEKIMYSKTRKSIKTKFSELYDRVNTGDIYIHISNSPHGIWTWFLYTIFFSLYQNDYFTHAGIIYKDTIKKKVYVIENVQTTYFCHFNNKIKSGVILKELNSKTELKKDINTNNSKKIFIFNTNIHKFITNENLYNSAYEYKDYFWGQDGLHCSNLIYNILVSNGIMNNDFNDFLILTPDMILNPKNYSVNVSIDKIPLLLEYDSI